MRHINALASSFEEKYKVKLPRIRPATQVGRYYNQERLAELNKLGLDIKAASERAGYTIQMPKGAATIQEFIKNPEIRDQMIANIGCPTLVSKSIGGRVNFSNGSSCYMKGLEKIKSGELNQSEIKIAGQFLKEAGTDSKIIANVLKGGTNAIRLIQDFTIGTGLLGPAINLGFNIPFAISEAQEGKPGSQVLGTLTNIPFIGPLVGTTERDELTEIMGVNADKYYKLEELRNTYNDNLQKIKSIEESAGAIVSPDDINFNADNAEYADSLIKQNEEIYNQLKPNLNQKGEFIYPKDIQKGLDIYEKQNQIRNKIKDLKTKQSSLSETEYSVDSPEISKLQTELENLKKQRILYGKEIDKTTTIEDMQNIEQGAQGAADGGRIGYKDGTDDPNEKPVIPIDPLSDEIKPANIMDTKLSRRQVIGGIGVAAGVPIVAKLINEGKATKIAQAAKLASKIQPTEGMYPWFPNLVEKIKIKGKPFEEKELIMEPSYKNDPRPFISGIPKGEEKLTKHVDGDTTFILREYPDGRIAVDIDSPRNQQSFGQSVSLYYRPKMEFKNYKGEVKMEPAEFKVIEPEPQYFANGPDDVDITFQEVPKDPNRNIVYADIEAAERFATGKIKNRKIIPVKQSLRNEMEEEPSTFIMRQSGELGSEARPEQIIKIPEKKATGGRVGFEGGGHPAIKIARLISEALRELKNSTSMVSSTARHIGVKNAKLEALTPYKNIPDRNQHIDILNKIEKTRENLPKEYHSILDDIKKDVENFDYIKADDRINALDEAVSPELKFENLSKDIFPMEDPLNDAFIIIDPEKNHSVGRYIQRYSIDPETRRGIVQTFDTWDSKNQRFYPKGEEQLRGVESIEKGKEGLN